MYVCLVEGPLIALKKIMPTGARYFELLLTGTVGTFPDFPLHNFNSNLYSRQRGREKGGGGRLT